MLRFLTAKDRVVIMNGLMRQDKRVTALQKFQSGEANILVATDLASRYIYLCPAFGFSPGLIGTNIPLVVFDEWSASWVFSMLGHHFSSISA